MHKILSSRIYSGDFDWKGKTYKGTYEPLVTRELWQWVQDALAGHRGTRIRKAKHDFPFSGLISCGHCGCALVGDIKKGKYVYYRCSGFKGKEGRDLILDAPHPRQFPLRPYSHYDPAMGAHVDRDLSLIDLPSGCSLNEKRQ